MKTNIKRSDLISFLKIKNSELTLNKQMDLAKQNEGFLYKIARGQLLLNLSDRLSSPSLTISFDYKAYKAAVGSKIHLPSKEDPNFLQSLKSSFLVYTTRQDYVALLEEDNIFDAKKRLLKTILNQFEKDQTDFILFLVYSLHFVRTYSEAPYRHYTVIEIKKILPYVLSEFLSKKHFFQLFLLKFYNFNINKIDSIRYKHDFNISPFGQYVTPFDSICELINHSMSLLEKEWEFDYAIIQLKQIGEIGFLNSVGNIANIFHKVNKHDEGCKFIQNYIKIYKKEKIPTFNLEMSLIYLSELSTKSSYVPAGLSKSTINKRSKIKDIDIIKFNNYLKLK